MNLSFAKVYLAKLRKLHYLVKFEVNLTEFYAFLHVLVSTKIALFVASLNSLAKVYLANFHKILHLRKFISEISRFFCLAKVFVSKVSTIKVFANEFRIFIKFTNFYFLILDFIIDPEDDVPVIDLKRNKDPEIESLKARLIQRPFESDEGNFINDKAVTTNIQQATKEFN